MYASSFRQTFVFLINSYTTGISCIVLENILENNHVKKNIPRKGRIEAEK